MLIPPAASMSPWLAVLLVALGAALGGGLRHLLGTAVTRRMGEQFPWGTLLVNISGAGALGLLMGLSSPQALDRLWLPVVVGVFGSYTTVSTFSLQTLQLLQQRRRLAAVANVGATLVGGLAALAGGIVLGRGW